MSVTIPLYLVTGLIYILSRSHNHEIKIDELGRDIRVRREIHEADIASKVHDILKNNMKSDANIVRKKRQLALFLPPTNNMQYTGPYKSIYNYKLNNDNNYTRYNTNGILNQNWQGMEKGNNTHGRNDTIIRNNVTGFNNYYNYKNWRANYTWRFIENEARHNNHRNLNYNSTFNSKKHEGIRSPNTTVVTNSTYNGLPGMRFINANRNFSAVRTYMPKFNRTEFRSRFHHGHRNTAVANVTEESKVYTMNDYIININQTGLYKKYNNPNSLNVTGNLNYTTNQKYTIPIPEFKGSNDNNGPHWYNNIGETSTVSTTTEENYNIISACVICKVQCPENMHRVGTRCVKDVIGSDY